MPIVQYKKGLIIMRVLLAVSLCLAAGAAFGQTNPVVDAEAEPVLRELANFYLKAPSFKVDMEADTRIVSEDMKQEFTTHAVLSVKKPDKLALTVRNSMIGSMLLVCDGVTITTYLPGANKYTVKPAPDSLEKMSREMGASSPACLPVISALIESDPYAALIHQASRIRYIGREKRGGVACHKLTFTHDEFDCDAWIRTGPQPLLEAIKPSLAKLGAAGKLPPGMKADAVLTLSNWDLSTNMPDALFKIALPADAQKTEALIPGMGEMEADEDEPEPGEALRLKPAPLFKLGLLGGGEFDLAAQKGKSAVVLCFWTTWAGPCRQTLPVLETIANAYKGKQVAVLPVNPQESEESIREFLKTAGLTLAVGLDKESDVAERYQVAGIPQIVIIDKAGIVREVYMGYDRELEQDLRRQLDLLALPEQPL